MSISTVQARASLPRDFGARRFFAKNALVRCPCAFRRRRSRELCVAFLGRGILPKMALACACRLRRSSSGSAAFSV